MFDYHIHSFFSGDSKMSMEDGCRTAILNGLKGIAFTDHIDYDYPEADETIFDIDLEKYAKEIERVREMFGDKLNISKGIEMGLQIKSLDKVRKTLKEVRFDVVIGSIHALDEMGLHSGEFCRNKTQNEAYRTYFEKTLEILRNFNDFDILGHIDIIRRYGEYADKEIRYSQIADIIDEIFKIIIAKGKGIEVNTSGYRYGLGGTLPSFEFIKKYRELGGEILTLASDSHRAEDIGFRFDIAKTMVKEAGFKYICSYENRIPVFHRI